MVQAKKIYITEDAEGGKQVKEQGDVNIDPFTALAEEEQHHDIKFRTLSWQKTTLLLFGEYVCLAILALAWSWSVVGWVAGFFITFGMGILTWCKSDYVPLEGRRLTGQTPPTSCGSGACSTQRRRISATSPLACSLDSPGSPTSSPR